MYFTIFRNNIKVVRIKPDNSSELSQQKQKEDIIRLNFTLNDFVEIKIGDYIVFEKTEQFYFINKKPRVTEAPKNNQYECIFEGALHEFRKTKVFLTTPKETGLPYIDYKFPLTGNAQSFLTFIVGNLNRNGGSYTVGAYKETQTVTVNFNNWNVFQAIYEISTQLGFSWYLDGKTLNFKAKEEKTSYVFQVGRFSGFEKLTRVRVDSDLIETVVFGYGSTSNMPPRTAAEGETYDSELLTENRLAFVGVDGLSKLENNVDKYGIIESIQEFDIKPEYTGEVTAISSEIREFIDTGIDFDIELQKIEGIVPKITFLTGSLIGLTFNISYDDSQNKITMDYYSDESGQYPNDIIKAAAGDTYKLFDLSMPTSYITVAENGVKEATQAYLDKHSNGLEIYDGTVDPVFIKTRNIILNIGDIIRVVSSTFLIDRSYEINAIKQSITEPDKYSIKFGDILPNSLLESLKILNFNTEQGFYNVEKTTYTTNQSNNQVTNIIDQETEWQQL